MPLRVVLADDGALFRQALADQLGRAGIQVLAQAGNAPLLLRAVEEHQPDVAIIDIRMPPTHTTEGIRAARQIRDQFPAVGILLLSTHTEIDEAVELLTAAPRRVGYLLKDSVADLDDLTGALTRISDGGTVFDPKLVVELLGRTRRADPSMRSPHGTRGAEADGRGSIQRRDRQDPVDNPKCGGKAHQPHLQQARSPRHPRHPPARPGRHRLPRRPVATRAACSWENRAGTFASTDAVVPFGGPTLKP